MSDATLPPLPSSSSAESQNAEATEKDTTQSDVFPFLVHSQDSVTNGDPPEVDNGKLARQKRRRTSPEDQATLEAEYKRNPKPDKTARMEIVKRVSLGEKEVQIWFQNRRQNTRRKSRPLLPHEIAAFGLGGMAALSSDPIMGYSSSPSSGFMPSSSHADTSGVQREIELVNQEELSRIGVTATESLLKGVMGTPPSDAQQSQDNSQRSLGTVSTEAGNFSLSQQSSSFLPATLGYLSNRRNAPSSSQSTPASSCMPVFTTPTSFTFPEPSSCPENLLTANTSTPTSSQIRLSMSLDGKAELVSGELSPPRAEIARPASSNSNVPRRRLGALQRSYSALPFGQLPRKSSSSIPFTARMPSGRSRDARTWEFCCDADARDELTTQAENESSGSAIAAISLLRSTSSSTLKPNANKRNALQLPKNETNKQEKKRKLGRAQSSLARLQSTGKAVLDALEKPSSKSKGSTEMVRSPSGDSDKENWIPHENGGNPQRRRPLPSGRAHKQNERRRALGDNNKIPTHAVGFGVVKKKNKGETEIFEDESGDEVVVDKEVEKFMRGEISPSKKGDLDCVQGLLSLSQGNWR